MRIVPMARPGLAAMAALLLLTLGVAGCGGSPEADTSPAVLTSVAEPDNPVTITYAGAAYSEEDLTPVFDAFKQAHPNITVNYEAVPFDDFNSVLSTRLGNASDSIDVFDVDMPRTDAYEARGWLADISEAFPDLADVVDPGSLEAATVGEKVVTMPYQTSTNLMYYNADLLKAADIPLPGSAPTDRMTWEDVTAAAEEAQAAGAENGLLFDQLDRYYQLEPLAISAGGGPGATGDGNLDPDVNNAGWVEAFSWYGSLYADGISPRGLTDAETPDVFAGGKTAFFVGGPWWAQKFLDAKVNFGVAPFPAFEGGGAATPTGGWSLGLNPKTSQERAQAALVFMKFMGVDDGGYAQYLSSLAVPPSNLEGAVKFYDADVFQDPHFVGVVDLMKSELAETATLRLQTVGYVEFEDVMTRAFSDIINGTPADEALNRATDELDEAWQQFE